MLNNCFNHTPNARLEQPSFHLVTERRLGDHLNFENRAFNALFKHRKKLRIAELYRCRAARMDGFLVTTERETILLEMKERLAWGSVQAAGFQFLAGRRLLKLRAKRGIVIFERTSEEWDALADHGAWGQLALHSQELSPHIEIGGLQVLQTGGIRTQPPTHARR